MEGLPLRRMIRRPVFRPRGDTNRGPYFRHPRNVVARLTLPRPTATKPAAGTREILPRNTGLGRYLGVGTPESAACSWRHWFINSASASAFIP